MSSLIAIYPVIVKNIPPGYLFGSCYGTSTPETCPHDSQLTDDLNFSS